jgi:signal peptidase II
VANSGAAFGLFRNGSTVFAAISIVVSLLILFYHRHLGDGQWLVRFSLGLQLGGAMGNLVDRLRMGYVTDFLDVYVLPVFNLADLAILCGVILLVLVLLREDRGQCKGAATVEERSGAAGASSP